MNAQILDAWSRACRAYEMARLEHERTILALRGMFAQTATPEECEAVALAEEAAFTRVQAALAVMRYFARACIEFRQRRGLTDCHPQGKGLACRSLQLQLN